MKKIRGSLASFREAPQYVQVEQLRTTRGYLSNFWYFYWLFAILRCSYWLRSLSGDCYWWRATASIRMHSLVNSLYFHWLFAILLCSDWLTVNQKSYLGSALHNPSYQVRLFLFPCLESQIYFCGSHFKFPSELLYIRLVTQIL